MSTDLTIRYLKYATCKRRVGVSLPNLSPLSQRTLNPKLNQKNEIRIPSPETPSPQALNRQFGSEARNLEPGAGPGWRTRWRRATYLTPVFAAPPPSPPDQASSLVELQSEIRDPNSKTRNPKPGIRNRVTGGGGFPPHGNGLDAAENAENSNPKQVRDGAPDGGEPHTCPLSLPLLHPPQPLKLPLSRSCNPKSETRNPKYDTRNLEPGTRNPVPCGGRVQSKW